MPDAKLLRQADACTAEVVQAAVHGRRPLLRVQSPPGAGKTRLTRQVMRAALDAGLPTLVAVQTNAQAIDLVLGMADLLQAEGSAHVIGFWPSGSAKEEWSAEVDALRRHPNVDVHESTRDASAPGAPCVLVGVARKWSTHTCTTRPGQRLDRTFELGVVDEADQMPTGELLRFGGRISRLLLIGDPGQLEPFTTVETSRWAGLAASPIAPAPRTVTALRGADVETLALPASLRLDERAAGLVQACFYPDLPFRAVALAGDRELRLARPARGRREPLATTIDATLDRAADAGWGLLELPAATTVRDDPELADALARAVQRLLARKPTVRAHYPVALRGGAPLQPAQVAVATAHRDQRARVREALARLGPELANVVVDTANRLQGREFDVLFAWHPLSGRVDASAFHLDTGRLCVMTSRHRQACVLVTRAGLRDLLEDHLPSGLRPRGAVDDREHDGWAAHRLLLERVTELGRA